MVLAGVWLLLSTTASKCFHTYLIVWRLFHNIHTVIICVVSFEKLSASWQHCGVLLGIFHQQLLTSKQVEMLPQTGNVNSRTLFAILNFPRFNRAPSQTSLFQATTPVNCKTTPKLWQLHRLFRPTHAESTVGNGKKINRKKFYEKKKNFLK